MERDHARYVGLEMHLAHAHALSRGEQLRVVSNGAQVMRYADDADPSHIQVWINNGIVTRTA